MPDALICSLMNQSGLSGGKAILHIFLESAYGHG
jgi:hypothetical protein